MKAKFKLILGRRKNYPMNIELEVYKGAVCRVFISTGVVLESAKQWDATRQLVIKHSNATQYNNFIHGIIENIEAAEKNAEEREIPFDVTAIRAAAKNLTSFESVDVIETFRRYVEEDSVRLSTKKMYAGYVNSLERFVKTFKGSKNARLSFGEYNYSLLTAFDEYMSKDRTPATMTDVHLALRKFTKRAKVEGLIINNPYDSFNIVIGKAKRRASLTTEQLSMIENIDRSELKKQLINEVVLDMFLFACYTGLRYSDVSTLLKSEIIKDSKGLVVDRKTIKTGARVLLPLYILFNGKAQAIAEKYIKNHDEIETLFPSLTPDAANNNLKKIEKMLQLPIHITFHTSRHTCASQLAERADNPFVIMDVLGHGEIETSMRYIHHSHRTSEKKLAEIDWSEKEEVDYPSNDETLSLYESIQEICKQKQLSPALTRMVVGASMVNAETAEIVKSWILKIKKTDYSLEDFGKRLEMLVE